jgi:UPF0755 protein
MSGWPGPPDAPPPSSASAAAGASEAPDAGTGEPPEERPPGEPRRLARRRRRRRLLTTIAVAVLVVMAGVAGWYEAEAHPFGALGPLVVVHVANGESTDALVDTLARHGVVGSALAFHLSLLIHGTPTVLPGAYALHANQPFSAVESVLGAGPDVFTLDVVPGYTLSEIEVQVSDLPGGLAAQFVQAVKGGAVRSPFEAPGADDLEGLLGTGSYQVLPGETGSQLLGQMTARFDRQAAAAGLTPTAAARFGLSTYQLVTVASITQKEGYYDKYMGKVARVIYNRLAAGTPLAMTSTVLYSLGQDGGTVTTADRQDNTPYNTYLHTGLTPTPICVPSPAALAAAASPPAGPWLYFDVVSRTGTTRFAATYQQQLANEKLAQSRGLG